MEVLDAIKKQMIYELGNLPCDHQFIELESYHEDIYENDKYLTPTGKYVCTKCGKEFSPEEYENIIKERKQRSIKSD